MGRLRCCIPLTHSHPSCLCWDDSRITCRLRILELLEESLLHAELSAEHRARRLVHMHASFCTPAKEAFKAVLAINEKLVGLLRTYLTAAGDMDLAPQECLATFLDQIALLLPDRVRTRELISKAFADHGSALAPHLATCCDAQTAVKDRTKARSSVRQLVSKKPSMAEAIKGMLVRASYFTLDSDTLIAVADL